MARQKTQAEATQYVMGIITEAGRMTFPENASVYERNFELNPSGKRERRRGLTLQGGLMRADGGPIDPIDPDPDPDPPDDGWVEWGGIGWEIGNGGASNSDAITKVVFVKIPYPNSVQPDNTTTLTVEHYAGYAGPSAGHRYLTMRIQVRSEWNFGTVDVVINGQSFSFSDWDPPFVLFGTYHYESVINPGPDQSPINFPEDNTFSGKIRMPPYP